MTQPINSNIQSRETILENHTSAVTPTMCKVNKIFITAKDILIAPLKITNRIIHSIGSLIYTKTSALINNLSMLVFGKPKGDTISDHVSEIETELNSVENWDNHRKLALIELKEYVAARGQNSKDLSSMINDMILSYKDNSELTENKRNALIRLKTRIEKN